MRAPDADDATNAAALGTAGDVPPVGLRLHEVMRAEGLGCEMRIALTAGGLACGGMLLLRARGGRPFSDTEIARAERLAAPLAAALRRFVADRPLRLLPYEGPPGVVVVGRDDTVKAASPGVQDWLYECLPAPGGPTDPPDTTDPPKLDHEALLSSVCNITATARRAPDGTAVTRMFSARGWALLPAVAAWYGIPPPPPGSGRWSGTRSKACRRRASPAAWNCRSTRLTTTWEPSTACWA
ncbi:hypothetical protein [Streptomyces mirabilis]|uniref:hypothetical protein n=1 Tax=Streptomyces mirabilis TaxID=68239 RepID=UPI003697BA02